MKWDIRKGEDVKPGEKCPCHDLLIFTGDEELGRSHGMVEFCPASIFDVLFAYFRDNHPDELMERIQLALMLR